ncbi:hypothetical protein PLUTE_a4306 [Pseudoalteromonas luteoviolacea DSM 6061]|nr:hypothetical protein [Pseudoalteromonas luteoviolacea DSM 6061]
MNGISEVLLLILYCALLSSGRALQVSLLTFFSTNMEKAIRCTSECGIVRRLAQSAI